jgi:hypothetical protein
MPPHRRQKSSRRNKGKERSKHSGNAAGSKNNHGTNSYTKTYKSDEDTDMEMHSGREASWSEPEATEQAAGASNLEPATSIPGPLRPLTPESKDSLSEDGLARIKELIDLLGQYFDREPEKRFQPNSPSPSPGSTPSPTMRSGPLASGAGPSTNSSASRVAQLGDFKDLTVRSPKLSKRKLKKARQRLANSPSLSTISEEPSNSRPPSSIHPMSEQPRVWKCVSSSLFKLYSDLVTSIKISADIYSTCAITGMKFVMRSARDPINGLMLADPHTCGKRVKRYAANVVQAIER